MSTTYPTQSIESPAVADWIPAPLFRFSLERYEKMVELGALTEQDRIQLLNGFLVTAAGYATRVDFGAGQSVPVIINGVQVGVIAVADVLP
jgi:hypothetical protein